ncbi:MAG TPA: phosphoribosylanthranilate isomerase [Moraxellaceae bacterium]|nr:phosphoribosylanthranilate isomerase [Moraxellaceae bacterium]
MPTRIRVKICGITRAEDAQAAIAAGADALGFVLYPPSPRYIVPQAAARLMKGLPPFVTPVALFVDPTVEEVRALIALAPQALLQFHGNESDAFCAQFGRPWVKALAVKPGQDVVAAIAAHPGAAGILLDAWHPDLKGGTGEVFDWDRFPRHAGQPLILAGGLTPANVAEAVRVTRPYAVDVSGGVEARAPDGNVLKGIKDADLIQAFIAAATAGVVQ